MPSDILKTSRIVATSLNRHQCVDHWVDDSDGTNESFSPQHNRSPKAPALSPHSLSRALMLRKGHSAFSLFRLFVEIGRCYEDGCRSCRQISQRLCALDEAGNLDAGLSPSLSSVSRSCNFAEELFGECWNLEGRACLFVREGEGKSFSGLTEWGRVAWKEAVLFFELPVEPETI